MTAAMPALVEPSQSLLRWQIGDVIQGGPFKPKNNVVPVPESPGLGVELDKDALQRWHQHYVDHGPMDHYYDPQKPGHFRRLPLD
jgi:glucarate dehydratase